MSSKDLAIRVRGLSKSYSIAHGVEKHSTFAETVLSRLKNPLHRPEKETFWALKDINFDIKKGEVVGIIGRNGAGKSTLLKILSRITEPTSGEIDLFGRVGSLLEVGTGFHPELTGRENIFLNGAILGMTKGEICKQFDAIVDFAGVAKFLDTAVKRYSSGMYVRLAFAVAAHLRSEILIIDEVLAVGDAEFQKKCLDKMRDVSATGRTVLFVSHNIDAMQRLCCRGVCMSKGRIFADDITSAAISKYMASLKLAAGNSNLVPVDINADASITTILLRDDAGSVRTSFKVGEPWTCEIVVVVRKPVQNLVVGLGLVNRSGIPIRTSWTPANDWGMGTYVVEFRETFLMLEASSYSFAVGLTTCGASSQYVDGLSNLEIVPISDDRISRRVNLERFVGCGVVLNQPIIAMRCITP